MDLKAYGGDDDDEEDENDTETGTKILFHQISSALCDIA